MDKRIQQMEQSFAADSSTPIFKEVQQREYRVQTAPGVDLRTLVVTPPAKGRWPTVLVRSCYPTEQGYYLAIARQYALRGFAYVIQFCRGTGGSGGRWEPNVNERADGKATVDWLCAQPWVGGIGYWGESYLALAGWCMADIVPPRVKTMYLTFYGTDRYTSMYSDGLFRHDVMTAWAINNAGFPVKADYLASCRHHPHRQVDEDLWGKKLPWYRQWVDSPGSKDDYWRRGIWATLRDIPARVRIPLAITEGWYDHHLGSGLLSFARLSPMAAAQSRLLVGPWNHWFEAPLEHDTGAQYQCEDWLRAFHWFQDILLENKQPKRQVSRYVIRGDYWLEGENVQTAPARLYLSHGQGHTGGLAHRAQDAAKGTMGFVHDPAAPLPSHGGEAMLESKAEIGSLLQPHTPADGRTVAFVSEPFATEHTILGEMCLRLRVKSTAEDTAFTARILEETPEGRRYNIRNGATTLAYRCGAAAPQPYKPGAEVNIEIRFWEIAWCLQPGTRLRVEISSSDFPQYHVHSNTPGPWAAAADYKVAQQSVATGPGSYLAIPFLTKGKAEQ